jgi:hypothetical protein
MENLPVLSLLSVNVMPIVAVGVADRVAVGVADTCTGMDAVLPSGKLTLNASLVKLGAAGVA